MRTQERGEVEAVQWRGWVPTCQLECHGNFQRELLLLGGGSRIQASHERRAHRRMQGEQGQVKVCKEIKDLTSVIVCERELHEAAGAKGTERLGREAKGK